VVDRTKLGELLRNGKGLPDFDVSAPLEALASRWIERAMDRPRDLRDANQLTRDVGGL
jgi:hypothetical protein